MSLDAQKEQERYMRQLLRMNKRNRSRSQKRKKQRKVNNSSTQILQVGK